MVVSDISPSLVTYIRKKYHILEAFPDAAGLIECKNVDAVFILSPDQYHPDQYHGEYVARALQAGKHVFVEKPVILGLDELNELIALKKQYPRQIVLVGYMRRYAGLYLKAKEILSESPMKTEYLRFRDIILAAPFFIGHPTVFYPQDIPIEMIQENRTRRRGVH